MSKSPERISWMTCPLPRRVSKTLRPPASRAWASVPPATRHCWAPTWNFSTLPASSWASRAKASSARGPRSWKGWAALDCAGSGCEARTRETVRIFPRPFMWDACGRHRGPPLRPGHRLAASTRGPTGRPVRCLQWTCSIRPSLSFLPSYLMQRYYCGGLLIGSAYPDGRIAQHCSNHSRACEAGCLLVARAI
jgi:hypothetical protein